MVVLNFGCFDYILGTSGGIVVGQAALIITLNTKRGYWEPTNKFHVLSTVLYLIFLSTVIYTSVQSTRSAFLCDFLWKVTATLYLALTMSLYSFYYVKSRVVNSIPWRGKRWFGRIVLVMIGMMGLAGLCFMWLPIKDVQYNSILVNGVCHPVDRQWINILWMIGDAVLSVLLLMLFIIPLRYVTRSLRDTPRSVRTLQSMKRLTEKNRNLLLCTVMVTIGALTIIAMVKNITMQAVLYLGAIDRLVALQCITMTFSYDSRDYFYCHACFILFCKKWSEVEQEEDSFEGYHRLSQYHTSIDIN